MGTFFDKLTSGAKVASTPEPANMNDDTTQSSPPAATRLKIETEEKPAVITPASEPEIDEEGELTVDIYDKGDAIVIQSTVAGVRPEDLDVSITDDMVGIRGKRERTDEIHDEHYYYKELFWGTFSRSVILPEEVDYERAEAQLKHGLLTIMLPKKKRGTQKLKVKVT